MPLLFSGRLLAALVLFALPLAASAQPVFGTYNPEIDVIQQGASFTMFAEPGAPTIDVIVAQLNGPAGVYRVGETVTLTQMMALTGSFVGEQETDRLITRSTINVLRGSESGSRAVIYSAGGAEMLRSPGQHPQLQSGDVIEVETTFERRSPRLTLREGLQIATSTLTLVLTLYNVLQ